MLSSSRALMILLLPVALAACDKQSQPTEQANAITSGEVPASHGNDAEKAAQTTAQIDRSKAGTAIPDAAFYAPDGTKTNLKNFVGKPLLVNLWATWCAPCVKEMPALDNVAAAYRSKNLTVLTISQDMQGAKVVKPFFEKHKLPNLMTYTDPDNNLIKQIFGVTADGKFSFVLPTTILYDAQGKEVVRVIDNPGWDGPKGQALIEEALKS